jgi:beta-galactosidase
MKKVTVVTLALFLFACPGFSDRLTVSLNGTWEAADSLSPEDIPKTFPHKSPVPGLTHSAIPPFKDVDRFASYEWIERGIRKKEVPESMRTNRVGRSLQNRNYFWYRTNFKLEKLKSVAILRIAKAQFGTAVWLNGKKVGEYNGCFSAGYFDLRGAIKTDNELIVRIGAHPATVPETVPTGTDMEKRFWTPGIYDNVSIILSDNPAISSVQVAPKIQTSEILVETKLKNYGTSPVTIPLTQRVGQATSSEELTLRPGEERTVRQSLPIPDAKLWTPETPHLYTLETSTGGDTAKTRFGMREFHFDTATKRAWLNNKPYFMRGSNVTLHRFFEDEKGGTLPWNEQWVRRLLIEVPKQMHWNSFRFCIGPVPEMWLDIADEAGLLIQNEFFIWQYRKQWDTKEVIGQFRDWMRDNWNHPSIAVWDADNETRENVLADIIRAVRPLDLSNRPWDNGYNDPVGPDDPVEDHPYLFGQYSTQGPGFNPTQLEQMTGAKSTNSPHPTGHAVILNEYGWLWMNRDGSPTLLTEGVYEKMLGKNATAQQRFAAYAYYLAGLTEFWRAHRNFAAVLHFVHLTSSYPGAYTSDHWQDVEKLQLEPFFADWVGEAFKPLGVYLNFWQEKIQAGVERSFQIMITNDEYDAVHGTLTLSMENKAGTAVAKSEIAFDAAALGNQTYTIVMNLPEPTGSYLLKASAQVGANTPTLSRRRVVLVKEKAK